MKQKVYLVCQRHLVKTGRKSSFWSEFYPVSQKSLFSSFEDANKFVEHLRSLASDFYWDNVDYVCKIMFLN